MLFGDFLKYKLHCYSEVDTDINAMTTAAGDTVTLDCRVSVIKDVTWQYQKTPSSVAGRVYYIGDHYVPRFTVNHTVINQYDLNVDHAKVADSGRYICIEDGGQGIQHIYDLSVIGKAD